MEIPKITTGLKAMGAAAAFGGDAAVVAAAGALAAGVGKKIFGGLFKKKDVLEKKFEKVLNERKRLFERVPKSKETSSNFFIKAQNVLKDVKGSFFEMLLAMIDRIKRIFNIIMVGIKRIAGVVLSLVKWIKKILVGGMLLGLKLLCKSGALKKITTRLKQLSKTIKKVPKGKAAAIAAVGIGVVALLSNIFKSENKKIKEISNPESDSAKKEVWGYGGKLTLGEGVYVPPTKSESEKESENKPEKVSRSEPEPNKEKPVSESIPREIGVQSSGGLTTEAVAPVMTRTAPPTPPPPPEPVAAPKMPAVPAPKPVVVSSTPKISAVPASEPVRTPSSPPPKSAVKPADIHKSVVAPPSPSPSPPPPPKSAPKPERMPEKTQSEVGAPTKESIPKKSEKTPVTPLKGKVPITIEDVKEFQKANGLRADGVAGAKTIDLMIKQGLYPTASGVKGMIISELNAKGIVSPVAIANILATVDAESGFKSRSEEISEETANKKYVQTDGNNQTGDGFKYRGRGFIQHTGRNQYANLSDYTGIDFINNPDLLNDPTNAAKAIPFFFLKYKSYIIKNISDLDSITKVNKAVAFEGSQNAESQKFQARISLAKSYEQTGEMGQTMSGTSLASAGRTQYDKDKNTKTNIIVASMTNNKTNNIEDKKAA